MRETSSKKWERYAVRSSASTPILFCSRFNVQFYVCGPHEYSTKLSQLWKNNLVMNSYEYYNLFPEQNISLREHRENKIWNIIKFGLKIPPRCNDFIVTGTY